MTDIDIANMTKMVPIYNRDKTILPYQKPKADIDTEISNIGLYIDAHFRYKHDQTATIRRLSADCTVVMKITNRTCKRNDATQWN